MKKNNKERKRKMSWIMDDNTGEVYERIDKAKECDVSLWCWIKGVRLWVVSWMVSDRKGDWNW